MDANDKERRRRSFKKWLLKVWEWAEDNQRSIAEDIAEILSHGDEPDYPLWAMAAKRGVTGDGELATLIRRKFGVPIMTPDPTDWEKQINYSPVIALDAGIFDDIYSRLGWVNRYPDSRHDGPSFYLWSEASNPIVFVRRRKEKRDASI